VDATQRFITAAIQAQERLVHSLAELPTRTAGGAGDYGNGDSNSGGAPRGAPEVAPGWVPFRSSIHRSVVGQRQALVGQANDVAAQLWALRMNLHGTGPMFPAQFVAGM